MNNRWGRTQVLGLAPDAASASAGQKLTTSSWTSEGATAHAVWGRCQGSGRTPYQTVVDLSTADPAYKCSCPSRKFPCKHVIALLLRWSSGAVPDADTPADFAVTWLDSRAAKADANQALPVRKPRDPEQAAKTAAARRARVDTGVAELLMWIDDQICAGLAGSDANPYARFDPMAARLVDAAAPGLAARVRRLPELVAGPQWPRELLTELGSIWALAKAHERLDTLDPSLADSVRRHVGYSVPKDAVLASPAVTDTWLIVGGFDTDEDRLQTRRTWLLGLGTRRYALILDFAPPGATLPGRPPVGTAVAATLHYYPGAVPQRALVAGDLVVAPDVEPDLPSTDVEQVRTALASAVAADPWLALIPVAVSGRLGTSGPTRAIVDAAGTAIPLLLDTDWPTLVAVSRGEPLVIFGELSRRGLVPLSTMIGGELWML